MLKDVAEAFRVTPSAVAMRARRLGRLDVDTFSTFMDELQLEYGTGQEDHDLAETSERP